MPELLTKHPDVALQVLRGAEAQCGGGQEQTILKSCPPERFCSTGAGELCVFGLGELSQMTQITKAELAELVCDGRGESAPATTGSDLPLGVSESMLLSVAVAAALIWRRKRHRPGS